MATWTDCAIGLHSVEKGEPSDVATAAAMFQRLCYDNKDSLSAGIIVAGWDKHLGGQVFNIPLGGSVHKQPFAIGGILEERSFALRPLAHPSLDRSPNHQGPVPPTSTVTAMPTSGIT